MLTFIHISDTHINPDPTYSHPIFNTPSYKAAVTLVEQINNLPFEPDFVLHTGDVAYDPDPEAYAACREILSKIKYPTYYIPGNHDESKALQIHMLGSMEPRVPFYYQLEIKGVQIVFVDSTGPAEPPAGNVVDEQLDWLQMLCTAPDDRPLVIAVHHNMLPVGIPWLDTYMRTNNGEQFHEAILPAKDRLRGVFFGHVHQNLDVYQDGILYCSALSSWYQLESYPGMVDIKGDEGAEPGYSIVTVRENQTFIRRCRYTP